MILLEDMILDAIRKSELDCSIWDEDAQKRLADELTVAVVAYMMQGSTPAPEGK
jgi:hypothetical protein